MVQPTHLKPASQNRHRRHQIHYRPLNMENHPNFLSLLKYTSQLKESDLILLQVESSSWVQTGPFLPQNSKDIFRKSTSETLLSAAPSHTLQLPVPPTPMPSQPGQNLLHGILAACTAWHRHTFTPEHLLLSKVLRDKVL